MVAVSELEHELERLAAERGLDLHEVADALRSIPPRPAGQLSQPELDVLRRLGIDPDGSAQVPVMAGVLRRRQLEKGSLTTQEAATALRRAPSRIRQRLAGSDRSLLGFHRQSGNRDWLLPRFQFDLGLHDLDGWARLLQALPAADDTSPTALVAWLTTPQAHLDGRSRAAALADGYDTDGLVAEAATYGMPA